MANQNYIQEVWKDMLGFENNYQISSIGRFKRKASAFVSTNGRIRHFNEALLGGAYNKGYLFVCLQKTGEKKKYPVHRMVAKAFIPNPYNLPQVNHKNGIRDDNRIENLEWCTNKENSRHAKEVLGKDTGIQNRKKVKCLNNNTIYESGVAAAKALNVKNSNISGVLNGRHGHTYGYKFEFVNE